MNSEDFFVFFYPALIILGVLISIIPAYIASKKNKNFLLWWISTACVFTTLLLVIIKAQAISLSVYLLAILPITSLLAMFLPKLNFAPKLTNARDAKFLLLLLALTLVLGAMIYLYLLYPRRTFLGDLEKIYFINLAVILLIACLGFTSFLFVVSERKVIELILGVLLTALLALPIFLEPSRASTLGHIPSRIVGTDLLLGPVVNDLKRLPIAGIFVLVGICAGWVAVFMVLNDKYEIINKIIALIDRIILDTPYIHFSKIPAAPVLVYYLLYIIFFKVFFHPTEGWIFLIPLVWLCLILPMFLFSFAGIILSTLAIGMSVSQKKPLYALCILSCGILASWKGVSASWYQDFFGLPGTLLVFYGATTGLIALILWVISDYRGKSRSDGAQP